MVSSTRARGRLERLMLLLTVLVAGQREPPTYEATQHIIREARKVQERRRRGIKAWAATKVEEKSKRFRADKDRRKKRRLEQKTSTHGRGL